MFVLICLLSTIDTKLFIYPSLSKVLLPSVCISILSIYAIFLLFRRKVANYISNWNVFFVSWIFYLCLHSIITPHEQYVLTDCIIKLTLPVALMILLSEKIISKDLIENVLLFIAYINLAYIILQVGGIWEPESSYFTVTGVSDNPNITAIFLTGCLPLQIRKIQKYDILSFSAFIIMILGIIILKCRTAYIGLLIILTVLLLHKVKLNKHFLIQNRKHIAIVGTFIILCAMIIAACLYQMKKDSADGRLLIWKLSAEMINQRPQGYGYGLFEKEYNLYQANYFLSNGGTYSERNHADHVIAAYNDFLEHGVQGGGIGMIFLAIFYIMAISLSWNQKRMEIFAAFFSFAIMSLTNFISTSILPWLLILCYSSLLEYEKKYVGNFRNNIYIHKLMSLILFGILTISSYHTIQLTWTQMMLTKYYKKVKTGGFVEESTLMTLFPKIGSSEGYWMVCARNYANSKQYNKAIKCVENALQYTSSSSHFYKYYQLCKMSGNEDQGIHAIVTNYGMLPHHITPKFILMQYYDRKGMKYLSVRLAKEIMDTNTKVTNKKSKNIKFKAAKYLKQYECNKI